MTFRIALRLSAVTALIAALSACGIGSGSPQSSGAQGEVAQVGRFDRRSERLDVVETGEGETLWDLFGNNENPNYTVAVNKYLWNASLEVLNFLPIQTVDPFTGVIVTGYGTPPGGGRSYRATIKISDPALDARSLRLSLQGAGGSAVAPGTVRAVEDAILTRARQLRQRDGRL